MPPSRIRNCIIAHIDHGTTLADILMKTKTVKERDMVKQVLDSMDLERERGITIKLNSARMDYVANDGELYVLNLSTRRARGFLYEVSRSLAACEGRCSCGLESGGGGADGGERVPALDNDLEIFTVLSQIDLAGQAIGGNRLMMCWD